MTLQLWDLNASQRGKAPTWQARNLPDDELDIKVPIFDTGLAMIDTAGRVLATSTGFGEVRHYDVRAQRKVISNAQVTKESMLLNNIARSKVNEHLLYVVTQEGNPLVLDRRFNCRVVRKMPGNKGTVRDIQVIEDRGLELLVTGGCDRHIRVFDHT